MKTSQVSVKTTWKWAWTSCIFFSLSFAHGCLLLWSSKPEQFLITKSSISLTLNVLTFEKQYILATAVGNRQAEHLMMIEHIKHFFFCFYVTAGWVSTSCSAHRLSTCDSFRCCCFFFSSCSLPLRPFSRYSFPLEENTNVFDYIITANFISPTSVVIHHKRKE